MMTLADLADGLVVHAPHASLVIPPQLRGQFIHGEAALTREAHLSADLWTDRLGSEAWPRAGLIVPEVSRLVVDVERYESDACEPMSRVGRGVIYTHDHEGVRLRSDLSEAERERLLLDYYTPHWRRLRAAAAGAVLVDLHSYPETPWRIEPAGASIRPQIDLGTDEALTPPAWAEALARHFHSAGLSVAFNTPYAGVIDAGARAAVMIEIRRDLMGGGPGTDAFGRLSGILGTAPAPPPP